ncbi:MAG TPA: thioredoxin family protein [Virgibacillus sp.]|nr:thioredoxin family protein [Virgibacillus sp.]
MHVIQTKEEWSKMIKEQNTVALFTADWCPDCRVIEPDLAEIEATFPLYTFVTVDRDDFMDIAQENDVMGIPSFIAFHQGKEVGRFVSKDRKTKEEIMTFLKGLPPHQS